MKIDVNAAVKLSQKQRDKIAKIRKEIERLEKRIEEIQEYIPKIWDNKTWIRGVKFNES